MVETKKIPETGNTSSAAVDLARRFTTLRLAIKFAYDVADIEEREIIIGRLERITNSDPNAGCKPATLQRDNSSYELVYLAQRWVSTGISLQRLYEDVSIEERRILVANLEGIVDINHNIDS